MGKVKIKPVKGWAMARDKTGSLVGHWASLGNGYEAVSVSAFLRKSHAVKATKKYPNNKESLSVIPVLITPISKSKVK